MNDNIKMQLIEKLLAVAKKEFRITYKKSENTLSALDSKFGGKPAVPKGFEWPHYTGSVYGEEESKSRPLSFMAQINLKDIAGLDETGLLPKSGILSFFYELETMRWGFDPKDKGSAKVFYFPDETALNIADYPEGLEDHTRLPELAIDFNLHISISALADVDVYEKCSAECEYEYDECGDYTKLLGCPDVIQNPMEEECETVTRGYSKIPEEEKADILEKSKEWILLFQMGTISADDYELMFEDQGHIYYWIKKEDLMNCNFENTWLILQCY